jgi:hypothetical protein
MVYDIWYMMYDSTFVVGGLGLPQGHLVDDAVGVRGGGWVVHVVHWVKKGEGVLDAAVCDVDGGLGAGQGAEKTE